MISCEAILKPVFFRKMHLFSQIVVFLQPQREATLAQLVEQRIRNA